MILLPYEIDKLNEFGWNTIVVIESLPERSGEELHNSCIKWMTIQHAKSSGYGYAHDKQMIFALLDEIERKVVEEDVRPILHFEMHGSQEGLVLESGEVLTWHELCNYLRRINTVLNNSLIVVLATCYGIEIATEIMPLARAPYRLVVAPKEKVSFGKVEEGFNEFYKALPDGIVKAIQALNDYSDTPLFFYIDITECFYSAWNQIKEEYNTEEKICALADYLVEIKAFISDLNNNEARKSLIETLCGGEQNKWLVYRNFMMAETLPDEGPNVFEHLIEGRPIDLSFDEE